ncbi:glyoxylate reductase/hydroxypyruvate reductase [Gracilaria domingensis]|nr:glyoxylate reductase/hydroxypyruvate reductase [Gracilaria domingensis]
MLRDASLDLDIWDSDDPMPHEKLVEKVSEGCDALYCVLTDKISADVLEAGGERLKLVSTMSVGYNHVDIAECSKRGIKVSHTPNVLTETTADTALGLVLAACRRFKEATTSVYDGTWGTWTPMGMCGQDVHDSTVGIIGMGRIGSAVARRLHAFNCKILYWDICHVVPVEEKYDAKFVDMDELLSTSDIIITLCPLNEQTTHMFNMEKFKKMKKSAVFINPARGELVNQDDLVEALQQGEIFSAGVDVTTPEPIPTDHPLTKLPNCFILPHIGSASMGTRTDMAVLASKNVVAAYNGKPLPSAVRGM